MNYHPDWANAVDTEGPFGPDLQGYLDGQLINVSAVSWSVSKDLMYDDLEEKWRPIKTWIGGSMEINGSVELPDHPCSLVLLGITDSGTAAVCCIEGVQIIDIGGEIGKTTCSFVAQQVTPWKPVGEVSEERLEERLEEPVVEQCCGTAMLISEPIGEPISEPLKYKVPTLFTGADINAYVIRGEQVLRIGNLESVTWENRYIDPNETRRTHGAGMPAIIGSLALSQWDECPLTANQMLDGPFSLAILGVNNAGAMSLVVLENVKILNSVHGFSMNDLGNTVGATFTCESVVPWHRIDEQPWFVETWTD